MEKFLFSLIILNIIAFGHTFNCTPNSTFIDSDGCNTCFCNEDGTNAACTMRECIEIESTTENEILLTTTTEESIIPHNGNGNQVCTPNEIKMQVETNETCNRCKCAANGIGWFCTKIPCPPRDIHTRSVRNVPQCTPGDRWMDDCNTCFCVSTGIAACTKRGCPVMKSNQTRSIRQVETKKPKCVPGARWTNDCNSCFCTQGGNPACTLMICQHSESSKGRFTRQTRENNCTPGERWQKDCNECFCTETGIAACTLRGCLGAREGHYGQSHRSYHTRVRQLSIPVISPEELQKPNFQCTPYEYFKVECNNCKCGSDGKVAKCTKKVCVDGS